MPASTTKRRSPKARKEPPPHTVGTVRSVASYAEEKGYFNGSPTSVVRGRVSVELIKEAKRRTGIKSDTQLLKVALANIALADDYWEWMQKHRGTVSPDLDLEF